MKTARSLRSTLYSLVTSLLAIALVLMVLLFSIAQARTLASGLTRDAQLVAQVLIEESRGPLLFADRRVLADKFRALRVYPGIAQACLYDASGVLVAGHSKTPESGSCPDAALDALPLTPTLRRTVTWHDAPIGQLDIYSDDSQVPTGVLGFVAPTAALALLVFLLVSVIGRRLAERTAAPLKALTASSRAIIQGDLSARMAVDGPQEVRELAQTFNAVIDDLLAARQAAVDDLKERRRTEEALSAAESRLRKIIDLVPYLIFAVRSDGSVIFANRAVAELYGVSVDALHDGSLARERAERDRPDGLLLRGPDEPQSTEIWFNRADNHLRRLLVTRVPFEEQPDPAAASTAELVVAVDVTEERRLQVQLQFSQRLEVVGTLAGGIAHDFNNLLTPIMGYTTLLMDRDLPADVSTKLNAIYSAALKARDLVQQILTFSRHQDEAAEKQRVDPAAVLDDAISLMRATIPSSIEIAVDVAPDVPMIHANAGQVHQVIVNLCTNAAQAIQNPRGHIRISLRRADATQPNSPPRIATGEFVELSVTDDGVGMSPEVRARIFEPFFTTKEVGKGSGLGLSVVHGIVRGHGGEITLSTEPAKGTTFHVYLPAARHDAFAVAAPTPARSEGHERVLLVDDEVSVARATKDLLENLGYEVEAFTQPVSALRQFLAADRRFDVVVTDNLMPEMTGLELAEVIRSNNAAIPIVLMSGYLDDRADQNPAITVSISKPTSGRELSNLIQKVMHTKTA
jgi:signal transduction histidine kinase/HAMP domain-containing protein